MFCRSLFLFRISNFVLRVSGRSSRRRPLPEQERPADWLCFSIGKISETAIFIVIFLFQRTYTIFPILTLGLFFQKRSICTCGRAREFYTFVESSVTNPVDSLKAGLEAKYGMFILLLTCFPPFCIVYSVFFLLYSKTALMQQKSPFIPKFPLKI